METLTRRSPLGAVFLWDWASLVRLCVCVCVNARSRLCSVIRSLRPGQMTFKLSSRRPKLVSLLGAFFSVALGSSEATQSMSALNPPLGPLCPAHYGTKLRCPIYLLTPRMTGFTKTKKQAEARAEFELTLERF